MKDAGRPNEIYSLREVTGNCWHGYLAGVKPGQLYGYRVDGEILLTADHDHHMNHAENANTHWRNGYIVAIRSIRKGEELTNDYREFEPGFCAAFLKKKRKKKRKLRQTLYAKAEQPPRLPGVALRQLF